MIGSRSTGSSGCPPSTSQLFLLWCRTQLSPGQTSVFKRGCITGIRGLVCNGLGPLCTDSSSCLFNVELNTTDPIQGECNVRALSPGPTLLLAVRAAWCVAFFVALFIQKNPPAPPLPHCPSCDKPHPDSKSPCLAGWRPLQHAAPGQRRGGPSHLATQDLSLCCRTQRWTDRVERKNFKVRQPGAPARCIPPPEEALRSQVRSRDSNITVSDLNEGAFVNEGRCKSCK
ncbi:unnamed protein product [Pleuronectes platessa]|uniref:Uncharacterized protein n=1 Tax=Pleuronectes platessa TaxID=8262 RepID=A0A9N7TST0_PLEPL|nr:unnamed protein product [Pleuronectes platessa]